MSTQTTFDAMLRSYAPNSLFREEITKRDWFLSNADRDDSWLGDSLEVRFKGAGASTIRMGSLTPSGEIGQSVYVKGSIANQPEVWGSLIFNDKDLMRHGKLSEQNFLKILPGEVEDFLQYMQMALSMSFTNGPVLAKVTDSTNANVGVMIVNRVERFDIGMRLKIQDNDTAAADAYVIGIDVSLSKVTLSTTRGGAASDFSAYTAGQSAVFYLDGGDQSANQLSSLKASLLSAANGGSASLYGQSKLGYPYLQAINVDGSTITASNILDQIFAAQTVVRNRGKGNPNKIVMSYKHLGSILAKLEALKGAYRLADDAKYSAYGWTEVTIVGVKGSLTVVAIQEMDDDYICILDMSAFKVYSNGFIRKRQNPDGREYFEVRNTTGYQYIVDVCFFGDMVLERPSRCGILYNISY